MNTDLLKNISRYLVRLLLGLLLIIGLLVWLTSSESTLNWSARQAVLLSNGKLTLQGVHGSLYGALHIEALSYQTETTRYEVKEVNLDWTPRSLLRRHIHISRLNVQELKIIQSNPAAEPAKLPASLKLPLTFSAPDISLARIVLVNGTSEQLLSKIHAGVSKSASQYQLTLRSMDTGFGTAEAEILLGDTHPYSVTAHAILQQKQGWIYRAEADASGSLVQLLLKADIKTLDGKANLNATLTPFENSPLVAAQMTAKGINPARLRKDLPEAALSAAVSLEQHAGGGLKGSLRILNDVPGPWDKSRLPVREISAQLSATVEQFDLNALHLDFAKAGQFNGKGKLRNGHLQLDLNTASLNPHELHSKLRQMRLAGNIRLQAEQQWQELSADLRYRHFKLHLAARHQDAVVQLRAATLQSANGSLMLNGKLALDQRMPFQLSGRLKNMNPAEFGDYPAANINASLSASGTLAGEAQATLNFSLVDSHFRQQPFSGHGKMNLSATRMWDSDVMLQLGHNHFELTGGYGNKNDQLKLAINAPKLAELDPELSGQVLASGILQGTFSAPTGNFDLRVDDLSWRKRYSLNSLRAKGQLNKGLQGPLTLDASLQGLVTPQLKIEQASLTAQGTLSQHTLQFNAKNSAFDFNSRISGGWHEDTTWSGVLEEMSSHGRQTIALKSPAKLELASQHFVLGQAAFSVGDASLVLHEIAYKNGQISSSGELNSLPLAYLQNLTGKPTGLKTDLSVSGNWQFDIADQINGHIAFWRESGDISLPTDPQTSLGLSHLSVNIDALNNQLQGRLEADGSRLGGLKADAQVMLTRRNDAWGIAGNTPVIANAKLSVESLAWLAPLINKTGTLAIDGAINAEVHADGTFAQPKLSGSISGSRFIVAMQNQGVRFTDGSFQVKLRDQELLLEQLTLHGGGGNGNLSGHGRLTLEGESPVMQLSLTADKLEVLSRPDRLLILSGTAHASATGKKLQIEAKLKADQGLIEMPKDDGFISSDDVTVLGQTGDAEKKGLPYVASFALDLDLGERFYVKGKGLDAQLGGTLKLTSQNGALPLSRGSIHVIKGSYSAYGQRLIVDRGILNFQGPLDNPGLNIIAMRKNQEVEAGVAVTGTLQAPRVKLVSNPDVPDSEKLSWLVLGYGLESSSGKDYNALNAAAGALLAAGESVTLQQKIARASGFEDVSIRGSGELEGTVLSLGKRISSRAYVSYEQGLTNANSLVKISYTLTRRLSVQAQAGSTPAVDLFYTFRFD